MNFANQRPSIDQLENWDRTHYWHAFTQMAEYEPFIIDRAEGCWLFDVHGNRFLDGVSSLWCNIHGHGHPRINQAISDQLARVAHVTSLGMSNPTTIELTRRLVDISPPSLTKVFYSSDGACAVEVAIKLAFQYWRQCEQPEPQRDLFLAVGNAYHGDTLGGVSVGGVSRFHAMFDPLLFQVVRGPCPDMYRLPNHVRHDQACAHYLNAYRELFERFGPRIAAVIIEPLVQGAAGIVTHPPGFLSGLRRLADEFNALLIADEIAVGMGRTGTMWACEQESVSPDFLCTGKGLTGGYLAMAATLTTDRIWNAFLGEYSASRSFFHGHTFGGNPLAAAAALATIELFNEEKTLDNVQRRSATLERLLAPFRELRYVGDIRQRGLIAAIELVRDKETQTPFDWAERKGLAVCYHAKELGVWLRPIGNVVILMPPLIITDEQLELLVSSVKHGLQQLADEH